MRKLQSFTRILNHPPLAPTLMLPFIFKRAFLLELTP